MHFLSIVSYYNNYALTDKGQSQGVQTFGDQVLEKQVLEKQEDVEDVVILVLLQAQILQLSENIRPIWLACLEG